MPPGVPDCVTAHMGNNLNILSFLFRTALSPAFLILPALPLRHTLGVRFCKVQKRVRASALTLYPLNPKNTYPQASHESLRRGSWEMIRPGKSSAQDVMLIYSGPLHKSMGHASRVRRRPYSKTVSYRQAPPRAMIGEKCWILPVSRLLIHFFLSSA